MSKTLRNHFGHEPYIGDLSDAVMSLLDVEVVKEYSLRDEANWRSWPGKHKNVMYYFELANGKLVGHNENPNIGWSFPVMNKPKDW